MKYRDYVNDGARHFRDRQITLAELARNRLQNETGATRLLLYVDQWEELYLLAAPREPKSDEDRQRAADANLFIDLVLEAAAKAPCTLVFSVRSDFYPDIQNHNDLRIAVQNSQVSLGTMNKEELGAVIEGPPRALGASVDKKLTERLIRDIGLDPGSGRGDEYDIGKLPLLEYALEQAWAKRTGPRIGLENYSGLEQALEERANALYDRLSAEEQAAAKRLFVSLVNPGEGSEDTRARIAMPDDAMTLSVIQTFAGAEARLIITDKIDGRGSVEVSHEALIRHWDRLRAWVDEDRESLRVLRFLRIVRAEWLRNDRDPGLVHFLPARYVSTALRLSNPSGGALTDDIKDYLEAYLEALRDHEQQGKAEQPEREGKERQELQFAKEWVEPQKFANERTDQGELPQTQFKARHLFICFSSKDQLEAISLVDDLEKQGLLCWISSRDVEYNHQSEIPKAIRVASAVVVIFSRNANGSPREMLKEIRLAYKYKIRIIIPVRIEDAEPIDEFDYELSINQNVDLFRGRPAGITKIVRLVARTD